jgi:phosphoribosyl-ATP pyrophosphohydrolase
MKSFDELWDELSDRDYSHGPDENTSTGKLLAVGVHGIGKKIVEEAAEVWMAAEYESDENLANEISQLLYHIQVLMLARGIDIEDVYEKL